MKKLLPAVVLILSQFAVWAQTQRTVLFEEFSGENCGPCASVNPYVKDFVDQHNGEVILLKYQTNIPSGGPLYSQTKSDVNTRKSYYSVNSAPWGQQDGADLPSSSNHPANWINQPSVLANRYAVNSPFSMSVSHYFSADGDSFYATVNVTAAMAAAASGNSKMRLRLAMVEDMEFEKAPGTNGETEFHHAMRKMYPTALGTVMANTWANGDAQEYNISGAIPSYVYDKNKITFVAFIQDDGSKDVHQSAISDYMQLTNDAIALGIPAKFFNCNGSIVPSFKLGNNGTTSLTSAEIEVYLDGLLNTTYSWNGSLTSNSNISVNLPGINAGAGTHTLKAVVSWPNGVVDANKGKDTSILVFNISQNVGIAPYVDGFESGGSADLAIENPDRDGAKWELASTGASSSKSYTLNFFSSPAGNIDYLYLPRIDLVGRSVAMLYFDRAHAQYNFGSNQLSDDKLDIEVSRNCGDTWQKVYSKSGATLATTGAVTSNYSPSASHWKTDSADISFGANQPDVLVRFKAVSGFGDNVYIDNVNIYQAGSVVSGINEVASLSTLTVYPNPATDVVKVSFNADAQEVVTYEIVNSVGQKLMVNRPENVRGENLVQLDTHNLSSGVYFLNVVTGSGTLVKKFTVNR